MESKAAIYCRLSKEDVQKINGGDDSRSIVNQQLMLMEYAMKQGFAVSGVYKDDDFSGLFDDRPGFEQMITDADAGKFNVIICKSQSRFTRNMEHLEKYLHHDFPMMGIRFIGVTDNVDTAIKGNKKSRQINGLVNEWYSEDLSENIRAVFRAKQKQGEFLGSSTPYGYVKSQDNKNILVPNPYAASIVSRIFAMYISGIGKAKIGAILSSEGVLIPSVYKVQVLGQNYHNANAKENTKLWSFQTIHTILKNEVYIGNMVQNKCSTVSYKSRKKKSVDKEAWIRVKGTHHPIIDEETFLLAQSIMEKKTVPVETVSYNKSLFWGILSCGECEKTMTRYYSKKQKDGTRSREGFICKTYKAHGNKFCTSHAINETVLHELVLQTIKEQAKALVNEETIKSLEKMEFDKFKEEQGFQLKDLNKQLQQIVHYKEKSYEDYADGVLSKDEYISFKAKYEEKESNLKIRIEKIEDEIEQEPEIDSLAAWVEKFKNHMDIDELTREVVEGLIDKIYIHEGNEIDIHFKFACE